ENIVGKERIYEKEKHKFDALSSMLIKTRTSEKKKRKSEVPGFSLFIREFKNFATTTTDSPSFLLPPFPTTNNFKNEKLPKDKSSGNKGCG
ncbi:10370_t:CDS:2, partial [Acaulospora morrowiae]